MYRGNVFPQEPTEYHPTEDLHIRLANADSDAFVEFAHAYGPRFRAYFIRQGLDIVEAEDLAASCTTDIALKAARYRPVTGATFGPSVFTLAPPISLHSHHNNSRRVPPPPYP